jgi:Spy/CpxP family protein refolding chaperone
MFTSPNKALPEMTGNRKPMRKRTIAAVLAAAAVAVTIPFTFAQTTGYGPGMMGGYGGYGGYHGYHGYGMGPGMMGGYGGYGGYGMGPGMMYGYGGYGMGPGMMGGYGGYGGYGMGPGMMYGYGAYGLAGIDLSDEQQEKIAKIQEEFFPKQWALMGQMREQQFKFRELLATGKADDAAIGKAFKHTEDLRQQMWASALEARKQIDAVLTKEQRDQLQRGWSRGPN